MNPAPENPVQTARDRSRRRQVGPASGLAVALALALAWVGTAVSALPAQPAEEASPFVVTPSLATNDGAIRLTVTLRVPGHHHLYAEELSFQINGAPATFVTPPPVEVKDRHSGEIRGVYHADFAAVHSVETWPAAGFSLTVQWRGCNEAECFFPESQAWQIGPTGTITAAEPPGAGEAGSTASASSSAAGGEAWDGVQVAGRTTGYLGAAEFVKFLQSDGSAGAGGVSDGGQAFAGLGLAMTLLLILLGGLALNLTPCVLPMIPINLAILGAGSNARSRGRGFALGGTYGAGMALAYGGLGLVVVLTGARFGTLNSTPWFNFAMAVIFVVLALGMFDRIPIDLSRFQRGGGAGPGGSGGGGGAGAFAAAGSMGVVSALLAGACVAPVVISVLLLATSQYQAGRLVGLLLPFVLGVGMALPWPFAAAGLSFLPKPGAWMTRVKQGFGVVIFAFAAWYGWLGWSLADGWNAQARAAGDPARAVTELQAALAESARTGRPVLVDFWASWCKNCSAMEHTTLRDPSVQPPLARFIFVKFQAEHPGDPAIEPVLKRFGVLGLPTYVMLQPKAGLAQASPNRTATHP